MIKTNSTQVKDYELSNQPQQEKEQICEKYKPERIPNTIVCMAVSTFKN